MQTCPSLLDLTTPLPPGPDLRAHLLGCATCRALLRLAAGNGDASSHRSIECDEIEPLIGALASGAALTLDDSMRLERHMVDCDRCAATSAVLLLDHDGLAHLEGAVPAAAAVSLPIAPPERDPTTAHDWHPAVDPGIGRSIRMRRRVTLAAGAAVVALAAAAIALSIARDTGSPAPAPPVASRPEPVPAVADEPLTPALVPAPAGGPTRGDAATFDRLLTAAKAAYRNGKFGLALGLCEQALAIQPGDQSATLTCAFASCRQKQASKARTYMRALTSETRQNMVRQTCLQMGVTGIDEPAVPAVPDDADETNEPDHDPSFDELLTRAKDAYHKDQFGRALGYCERAVAKRPGDQNALLTCAFASCRLKRSSDAKAYVGKVTSQTRRAMVNQTCLRAGVPLD